jgi:ATP-dependent DNA helicase DinG
MHSKHITDKKPGDRKNRAGLSDTLNHIFTDILPRYGYAVRGKQIELAEHILNITARRGVTLAESEVGTGKTHAYLISAALAKRGRINEHTLRGHYYPRQSWAESAHMPVVISTSSIALQDAIHKDYIPGLSRILLEHNIIRTPLVSAVRKGKEHYVCERRLRSFNLGADENTQKLLKPFMGEDAPFDLTGADSLTPYIKRRICVSGSCENCGYTEECRYRQYLAFANSPEVDFLITNHNYFLADTLHRARGKRPLLPHYQLVVIDEAHKFLAAARSMYGLELTDRELPELAREIHTFTIGKSNKGVNIHRFAKRLEEQSGKLFGRLNENIPESEEGDDAERFHAVFDVDVCRRLKRITGITDDLIEAVADSHVQKPFKERRSKALWRLNMIGERISGLRKQDKLIHWLEKSVEGAVTTDSLCAIPKDLNERLHRDLWSKGIPIVLTSGTLSASGDFTRAKETLGLDRMPIGKLFDTTMPSPFDHKNNVLLYISENTPFPDIKDNRYITAIADEIERLVLASHGHAAVLFTSYKAMGQVHAILNRRKLPFPLFRLERGGVHAIERFKKSGNGILLASGALWEGIDIPGDTLSMLIIVKLPFAVPDPIGDYERSLCGSMEIFKARCIVPDMQVRLKQGAGRLIRCETDTGVIAILDSRVNERGAYRGRVLSALPACRVTSRLNVVSRFIWDKKSAEYFKEKKGGLSK